MKIRQVSCTQFAGVRDRSVSFSDGMNIIYGKNETGKSTLVNLISRTLFQDAKLDRRKDKDFFERYFPAPKKGAARIADFVDGKITFEDENGTYILTKEWGTDARCTLATPDGIVRDSGRIGEILKQTLVYGEGVYADMLLSSQNHANSALQTVLDAATKSDARQELANVVTQAFAESDGISAEAISQAIRMKIEEIAGKHWDMEHHQPVRKAGRWSTGLGEILKAYYAMEDARSVVKELSDLEAEAEDTAAAYREQDAAARAAEEAVVRFQTFASRLAVESERRKAAERIQRELDRIREVLAQWPKLHGEAERAMALQRELENRILLDRYEAANRLYLELQTLETEFSDLLCPTDTEIGNVASLQRRITQLENKLCGMNLQAAVHMLNGHTVEIVSLRTGLSVDPGAITEAVRLTVPGIMEMELSPANVDVEAVRSNIADYRKTIDRILGTYEVASLQELEQLAQSVSAAKTKADTIRDRLSALLGPISFMDLKAAADRIVEEPRSEVAIRQALHAACDGRDAASYITAKQTVAAGYAAEYGTVSDLKCRAFDLEEELRTVKQALTAVQDIPAEFLAISDPDGHLETLRQTLKKKQEQREAALTAKTTAVSRLESLREQSEGDARDQLEQATHCFTQQKELLLHWVHIEKVFLSLQEQLRGNPMQGLADRFAHYLSLISGDSVTTEFPDGEKLNVCIYNREDKVLGYEKLSEGTKETVSLAFRLAVLDHLFPNGGVIVLDDPFTDMDSDRAAQACRLLEDCATRHQVIFLTCREDYLPVLNGNLIRF